jgi:hypothetical protein
MSRPALIPCSTRNPISASIDQAEPARADPVMNTTSAVTHTAFAPKRALAQPVSGITLASASRYPVITH